MNIKTIKKVCLLVALLGLGSGIGLQAQQSSVNAAGDYQEDNEDIVQSNYWTLGELMVGTGLAGDITNYSGLIPVDLITDLLPLGLTEQEIMAGLVAYPNPAIEQVQLHFHWDESEAVFQQIFDVTGQLIWEGKAETQVGANTHQIELSELPTGLYVVRIVNADGEKAAVRIIKK